MKVVRFIYLLLTSTFLLACSVDEDESGPAVQGVPERIPINWDVESAYAPIGSRALIDNNLLESRCTPKSDGTCESIGIWGQYVATKNGQATTYVEFDSTPLTFAPKEEDTNPHNSWNYPGESRYWENGAMYYFRACYPLDLMKSLMTQMDATVLQGGPINTSVLQEDILVAVNHVNTITASLTKPVQLDLQHVFAAIRFKIKADDGFTPPEGEAVTSCWLQNTTDATDLFSPSGYLVHSGDEKSDIKWYTYESSKSPMYVWKHKGVPFDTENLLYTPNDGMQGDEYTNNDGWLLVVPQEVKEETLTFCYTMKNTGDMVFTTKIPHITYECGKQYTYILEIRGSGVDITLKIADWNKIDSSHDIIL